MGYGPPCRAVLHWQVLRPDRGEEGLSVAVLRSRLYGVQNELLQNGDGGDSTCRRAFSITRSVPVVSSETQPVDHRAEVANSSGSRPAYSASYWIVMVSVFDAGEPGFVATTDPVPAVARSLAGIATF